MVRYSEWRSYSIETSPIAHCCWPNLISWLNPAALSPLVNLIQYNWLKSLTRCEHAADADTILSVLEKEAVLVKGCWVLKSERACSSSAARLIAARDYMLLQWIDGDFIDRNQVTEQVLQNAHNTHKGPCTSSPPHLFQLIVGP